MGAQVERDVHVRGVECARECWSPLPGKCFWGESDDDYFFFFVNDFESIFNHSCSPTIQYHIGPSLRDHLPCISALLRTIEVRLQERPTTQTFSAHWGCF